MPECLGRDAGAVGDEKDGTLGGRKVWIKSICMPLERRTTADRSAFTRVEKTMGRLPSATQDSLIRRTAS